MNNLLNFKNLLKQSFYFESEPTPQTVKRKTSLVFDMFMKEYQHEVNRKGVVSAFTLWLQGLPSYFNLPIYNGDIIEWAESVGYKFKDDDDIFKFLDGYYSNLTLAFFSLMKEPKTLLDLAIENGLKDGSEYYQYINESYLNGQIQQAIELFNVLPPDEKNKFIKECNNRGLFNLILDSITIQ